MIRLIFLTLITTTFFPFFKASGQVNNSVYFSKHFNTTAANTQPSMLGRDFENFELNLLNTYAYFGNTAMTWGRVNEIAGAETIDQDLVDKTLADLEENNHLTAGANFTPLSLAFKINDGNSEFLTFSLSARTRALSSFQYSNTLFDVVWNGNKKFKGQNVNLGPAKLNAVPISEYSLGLSGPLPLDLGDILIRPGLRFSFMQSFASFYTERGNLFMSTQENARAINFKGDYRFNRAGNFTNDNFNLVNTRGTGLGIDAGVTVDIGDQISGTLSITDIGNINFDTEVKNFDEREAFAFRGINVDVVSTVENDGVQVSADSVTNIFEPDTSNNAFDMPLGTRLILQGEYKLGEFRKDGEDYYKHHFFFLYQQGFQDHLNAITRPYFSVGYTHSIDNTFNFGGSLSMGGYNKFAFGPYLSLNAGPFKLGLGSNNILPLIGEDLGTGVDASFNLALSF